MYGCLRRLNEIVAVILRFEGKGITNYIDNNQIKTYICTYLHQHILVYFTQNIPNKNSEYI